MELKTIQGLLQFGIWEWFPESGELVWDGELRKIYGVSESEEITYELWASLVHPKDLETLNQHAEELLNNPNKKFNFNFRVKRPDGNLIWMKTIATVSTTPEGIQKVSGLNYDITDEINKEQSYHHTREIMEQSLERMPGPVYSKLADGSKYLYTNSTFWKAVNHEPITDRDFNDYDLFSKEIADELTKNDRDIIESGEPIHFVEEVPGPGGKLLTYDTYKFPLKDDDGRTFAVSGVSIDITERIAAEDKIETQRKINLHQAKLASIGELAAGVGHEINNPLTIALGKNSFVRRRLENPNFDKEKILSDLNKSDVALKRISTIVQGLRTFARADNDIFTTFDFGENTKQSIMLLSELYKREGIDLQVTLPEHPVSIEGNSGRIQQVVVNLLTNAKDALEGRDDPKISITLETEAQTARLVVADSGPGIPEEIQDRIFDNFYTTKDTGKGTGMGLALCSAILKEHRGKIFFETDPSGTRFIVEVPLANSTSQTTENNESESTTAPLKTESKRRILLVDDEEDVRQVIAEQLEEFDLDVDQVSGAKAALDRIKKNHYDILLTDLKMPEMNGQDLIQEVRKNKEFEKLHIIAMTGGVSNQINIEDLESISDGLLLKPFDSAKLAKILLSFFAKGHAA